MCVELFFFTHLHLALFTLVASLDTSPDPDLSSSTDSFIVLATCLHEVLMVQKKVAVSCMAARSRSHSVWSGDSLHLNNVKSTLGCIQEFRRSGAWIIGVELIFTCL